MFLFDVDGTLTPTRELINKKFSKFFYKFCENNEVYIVTGSDRAKTVYQLGETLYNKAKRVYQCSGSDVWEKDKNVNTREKYDRVRCHEAPPMGSFGWECPSTLSLYLELELNASKFEKKTGKHIEERPGMINFSILGRGEDSMKYRSDYVAWDRKMEERDKLAQNLRRLFPHLGVTIGGQTGLDIAPAGHDKSQVLRDFETHDNITFFGDKTFVGGNDYTLAHAIITQNRGKVHQVSDYNDTWEILRSKYT